MEREHRVHVIEAADESEFHSHARRICWPYRMRDDHICLCVVYASWSCTLSRHSVHWNWITIRDTAMEHHSFVSHFPYLLFIITIRSGVSVWPTPKKKNDMVCISKYHVASYRYPYQYDAMYDVRHVWIVNESDDNPKCMRWAFGLKIENQKRNRGEQSGSERGREREADGGMKCNAVAAAATAADWWFP